MNILDNNPPPARISTGVAGLDQILGGGLSPSRMHLFEGMPGTGKTTFGLRFLIAGVAPVRVVFDSLSEMRLPAHDPLHYRRQILALKQFFARRNCTVVLLDDKPSQSADLQLHSIAHGVVSLDQASERFGTERRHLRMAKCAASSSRAGCTTSRSTPAGSRSTRAWSPRIIRSNFRPDPALRALPDSTSCSVAA